MSVTSIRLKPEIENPLAKLAIKLERSKSYLVNQAVKEFLARKSIDESRWEDTLVALDSVKYNDIIEENCVSEWLESWGSENELNPPKR